MILALLLMGSAALTTALIDIQPEFEPTRRTEDRLCDHEGGRCGQSRRTEEGSPEGWRRIYRPKGYKPGKGKGKRRAEAGTEEARRAEEEEEADRKNKKNGKRRAEAESEEARVSEEESPEGTMKGFMKGWRQFYRPKGKKGNKRSLGRRAEEEEAEGWSDEGTEDEDAVLRHWNFQKQDEGSSWKAGYLQKQSRHLRQWRKRWFILDDAKLYSFKNKEDLRTPTEVIDLKVFSSVKSSEDYTNKPNSFDVHSPDFVFSMVAESESDKEDWIRAIGRAIVLSHPTSMDDSGRRAEEGRPNGGWRGRRAEESEEYRGRRAEEEGRRRAEGGEEDDEDYDDGDYYYDDDEYDY